MAMIFHTQNLLFAFFPQRQQFWTLRAIQESNHGLELINTVSNPQVICLTIGKCWEGKLCVA